MRSVPKNTAETGDQPAQMLNEVYMVSSSAKIHARGMAMVFRKGNEHRLVVYVQNLRHLYKWQCYALWTATEQGMKNIGDFTVNSAGDAVLSVNVAKDFHPGSIPVTLEPKRNDPSPMGPTILKSTRDES